jgi:hypothetical protein
VLAETIKLILPVENGIETDGQKRCKSELEGEVVHDSFPFFRSSQTPTLPTTTATISRTKQA